VLATLPASAEDEAVAGVDLGHERCSLAIGKPGGAVDFARTFIGGGLALSKALAAEFQIPLAEAQSWKEAQGAVGAEVVGPDAERAAAAFMRALQPGWCASCGRASVAGEMRRPVTRLLLCGLAKLLGLPGQLERDLSLPAALATLPPEAQGALGLSAAPRRFRRGRWRCAVRPPARRRPASTCAAASSPSRATSTSRGTRWASSRPSSNT
jgi:general secretion pathway protein L